MISTFKLTKAEFKKIFKRPSVFIMAILLVLTIFISMSIFSPDEKVNTTITYENATTSSEYYNNFYNDVDSYSKESYDNNFAKTDEMISYYRASNNNTILLTNYYNDVISTMDKMISENNTELRDNLRKELVTNLKNFSDAYKNLDTIKDFSILDTVLNYTGTEIRNYYTNKSCERLDDFYIYATSDEHTSKDVVQTYVNNDHKTEFNNILNSGINYIYTTINGLADDFENYFSDYTIAFNRGRNELEKMKLLRTNLQNILTTLDNFLETLVDNDYPVIITNKSAYQNLNQKIDDVIQILNISVIDNDNINKHGEIKTNIEASMLISTLNTISSELSNSSTTPIKQIHLNVSTINNLEEIQKKVNENKTNILEKIENFKNDESTKNISKEITNYSLLETAYSEITTDKVLMYITNDYDSSTYTKFYGYNFNEFNKYQVNESISLNTYYIDNNSYSNEYLSNFSFNQNSGEKTNTYDFMFFTLELCTVIIVVFSIMLICNLITGETESGTIKLLLVRPFKRAKIITAKLLATIFFILTFVAFSALITFVGGCFVYGYTSTPILAVFNSTSAFVISPIVLMLINILTLTFDIIFYVLLALMIAIICKNYAGAISASFVLLIVNYAMNILFGGAFWYSLLPGMNLHMFKYFGSAFVTTSGVASIAGVIQSLLITGIETSMNFWFSLFINVIYSLVFLAISYSVFQKRDF